MNLKTKTVCINLQSRKDRKKKIKKLLKQHEINYTFYNAKLHKNPKTGCINSHLAVIKNAINENKYDYVFILEDDIKFINDYENENKNEKDIIINYNLEINKNKNKNKINEKIKKFNLDNLNYPDEWDMLYFGGTIKDLIGVEKNGWVHMTTWNTHAYIINLKNKEMINDILKLDNNIKNDNIEIDKYYLDNIHPKYKCFMHSPMLITQEQGYSDIEMATVNYNFMEDSLKGFRKPESEEKNGEYILKLSDVNIKDCDLPKISIITPTKNRRNFFSLPIYNYENFDYPKDKIEWIIVEQTDTTGEIAGIWDLLPVKERYNISNVDNIPVNKKKRKQGSSIIKYLELKSDANMTIAQMRNMCVNLSSGDIIIHMDDDDYYPPESIMTRVKLLLKYKNDIGCVGCSKIGVYDIYNNKSTLSSDGVLSMSEASMGYWRIFWDKQNFNELETDGEYKGFLIDRFEKVMDIPYSFIIIATKHNNREKEVKTIVKYKGNDYNFFDSWDLETRELINSIRKILL
jgi:hypothetical protein